MLRDTHSKNRGTHTLCGFWLLDERGSEMLPHARELWLTARHDSGAAFSHDLFRLVLNLQATAVELQPPVPSRTVMAYLMIKWAARKVRGEEVANFEEGVACRSRWSAIIYERLRRREWKMADARTCVKMAVGNANAYQTTRSGAYLAIL